VLDLDIFDLMAGFFDHQYFLIFRLEYFNSKFSCNKYVKIF